MIFKKKKKTRNKKTDLANKHLGSSFQEQESASKPVDGESRDERRRKIHDAENDGSEQSLVTAEPNGSEQNGSIERHDVDPRQLLKRRDCHRQHQVRPVPPFEYGLVWLAPGGFGGYVVADELIQLGFGVRIVAADLA